MGTDGNGQLDGDRREIWNRVGRRGKTGMKKDGPGRENKWDRRTRQAAQDGLDRQGYTTEAGQSDTHRTSGTDGMSMIDGNGRALKI